MLLHPISVYIKEFRKQYLVHIHTLLGRDTGTFRENYLVHVRTLREREVPIGTGTDYRF